MRDNENRVIKIRNGLYKQIKWNIRELDDDEFDNRQLMIECIINDFTNNMKKIPKTKRKDFLFTFLVDNFHDLENKGFKKKQTRSLGNVADE